MDWHPSEIDDGNEYAGFPEALRLVLENAHLLGSETIPIARGVGRAAAESVRAPNSYPSADISLKDGFAVQSSDVMRAADDAPVSLEVIGAVFAGACFDGRVRPGSAVRLCSGAPIPRGADAVVAAEFCEEISEREVRIKADAEPGRNVMPSGSEIAVGASIIEKGNVLSPGILGLAAAAGIGDVCVRRRPTVAMVGLGDELVAPGRKLRESQVYASNLVTLTAWLDSFGIECGTSVVRDDSDSIRSEIERQCRACDVVITSGGAWGSERDLVVGVLDSLRWKKIFHRVRMGPGKGIAFGLMEGKPVFCLPGGPASNEMAFLQLAFPGILRMSGDARNPLPTVPARLLEDVPGRQRNWTEFKDAVLARGPDGGFTAGLYKNRSRLQAIAWANGIICVPEGRESLDRGETVPVQAISPLPGAMNPD
jgi:molybdopterin molybdotransferase